MSDAQALKDSIDLREWVERDLGQRPMSRGSQAWTFKCPFHHEQKGASLAVYRDGWKCWGQCGIGGDLYAWIARRHQLDLRRDFAEILRLAGGQPERGERGAARRLQHGPLPPSSVLVATPPATAWQAAGQTTIATAQRTLYTAQGRAALAYLMQQRGLTAETIQAACLGYIPAGERWHIQDGLLVPSNSILIPWFADGVLWGIKCRCLGADHPRYVQVKAAPGHEQRLGESNLSDSLYWADQITPQQPIFIVEGEFNCLSVWQTTRQLISPVSIGTSGQSMNVRWLPAFMTATHILAWLDSDTAGQHGLERLTGLSARIHPVALPPGARKDINDLLVDSLAVQDAGAIERWITLALDNLRTPR